MNENPTSISTKKEFNSIIESKIINESIIISGQNIKTLGSLEKVNGILGLSNSNLENLGELKHIQSDFWISSYSSPSNLNSLGKLEYVGGEMNLRYSNLENLGKLKKVEGIQKFKILVN